MHFGENQLFPGSIGISPALPTVHPRILPDSQVRASTQFYLSFTLTMGRSPGFGSDSCDLFRKSELRPIRTRFRYGSATKVA